MKLETLPMVKQFPDCPSSVECRAFLRDLEEGLAQLDRPQVVFDLSRIQRLNAVGIDLLLKCVIAVANRDGELKLAAPSPETALVLELTQVDSVLPSFPTVDEAMASFGAYTIPQPTRMEPLPYAA